MIRGGKLKSTRKHSYIQCHGSMQATHMQQPQAASNHIRRRNPGVKQGGGEVEGRGSEDEQHGKQEEMLAPPRLLSAFCLTGPIASTCWRACASRVRAHAGTFSCTQQLHSATRGALSPTDRLTSSTMMLGSNVGARRNSTRSMKVSGLSFSPRTKTVHLWLVCRRKCRDTEANHVFEYTRAQQTRSDEARR